MRMCIWEIRDMCTLIRTDGATMRKECHGRQNRTWVRHTACRTSNNELLTLVTLTTASFFDAFTNLCVYVCEYKRSISALDGISNSSKRHREACHHLRQNALLGILIYQPRVAHTFLFSHTCCEMHRLCYYSLSLALLPKAHREYFDQRISKQERYGMCVCMIMNPRYFPRPRFSCCCWRSNTEHIALGLNGLYI